MGDKAVGYGDGTEGISPVRGAGAGLRRRLLARWKTAGGCRQGWRTLALEGSAQMTTLPVPPALLVHGRASMNRSRMPSFSVLLTCLLLLLAADRRSEADRSPSKGRAGAPTVILAADGTGDFGPQTPRTRTAGWQEALDYCAAHQQDLYVKGGYGGRKAVYQVGETIRFPPAQDFRVDGGVYVVNWTGPADRDLMVIDSSMNCEYHLGILVYGGAAAGLR